MWVNYPEFKPTKSGYYHTYYYNIERGRWFYKPIWYSTEKVLIPSMSEKIMQNEFIAWRAGVYPVIVRKYIPESRNDYYIPCWEWVEKELAGSIETPTGEI